jgi:hypothetical protein
VARTKADDRTLDLFEVPQPAAPIPAGMDYRALVAALVARVFKEADADDRYEIAARMSRLTGREVSKYMLDAYTSEAREEFNLPFWLVPALETACGTHDLTNWLVATRGGRMYVGREALTAELGQLEKKKLELERLIKNLKKRMGDA